MPEEDEPEAEEDIEDESYLPKHWPKYTLNSKDILKALEIIKKIKFEISKKKTLTLQTK